MFFMLGLCVWQSSSLGARFGTSNVHCKQSQHVFPLHTFLGFEEPRCNTHFEQMNSLQRLQPDEVRPSWDEPTTTSQLFRVRSPKAPSAFGDGDSKGPSESTEVLVQLAIQYSLLPRRHASGQAVKRCMQQSEETTRQVTNSIHCLLDGSIWGYLKMGYTMVYPQIAIKTQRPFLETL